jgi:uncharacterized protein
MSFNYNKIGTLLKDKEIASLKLAEEYVHKNMPKDDVHGFGHVHRVVVNCVEFIQSLQYKQDEKFDSFILLFAAWFHDIGRIQEEKLKKNHALISGDMTREYIAKNPTCIPACMPIFVSKKVIQSVNAQDNQKQTIERIIECIQSHSFSSGRSQDSFEAKLLSDADKIDALGSIGIYRAACYQHDNGTGIEGLIIHFHEKLLILDQQLHTSVGKEYGSRRVQRMREYLQNLKEEIS